MEQNKEVQEKRLPPPNRREVRVKVMQALYAALLTGEPADQMFEKLLYEYWRKLNKKDVPPDGLKEAVFLRELYYNVLNNQPLLEKTFANKLDHWDLSRVAMTDRVLLLMGVCEMLHFEQIPVKVTINEYLEIGKAFSTEKSPHFLNGVLDAVHLELSAEGLMKKSGFGLMDKPDYYRKLGQMNDPVLADMEDPE